MMSGPDPVEGEELGGALEELRRIARVYLPDAASYYATAATHIGNVDGLAQAMTREVGEGGTGHAYASIVRVRDVLHNAFGTTANNLNEVGVAFGWAVDALAAADDDAAYEMQRIQSEIDPDDNWTKETDPIDEVDTPAWTGPAELPENMT